MNTERAVSLLRGIAEGEVALADVARLTPADIDAIVRIGAAALVGKRYDIARAVFAGLVALDPKNAQHLLHLAAVEHAAGRGDDAVQALTRYLDADLPKGSADVARALLMRAELVARTDKQRAAIDIAAARALAAQSPAARAVVEGGA